jgi:hypothetical protein
MKNKLKILMILAIGIFLLPTCQKDPSLRMPDLSKGVIPKIEKDATKDLDISSTNLAGFNATINVGLYYKDKPKSMTLMVCMNDDLAKTGVVKADITEFPAPVNITVSALVDILPGLDSINQLVPGDYFKFYVDVTLEDGTVVNGNDTLYDAYNSSIRNLPGSSLNVIYTVLCPFQPPITVGSYHEYSDPSQWNAAGDVTLTADASDQYTIYIDGLQAVDFITGNGAKLAIHIDPVTFAITGEKTVLADNLSDWGASYAGYTNYSYTPTEGLYNTCDGSYAITFEISYDQGTFGPYKFTFTKN